MLIKTDLESELLAAQSALATALREQGKLIEALKSTLCCAQNFSCSGCSRERFSCEGRNADLRKYAKLLAKLSPRKEGEKT